MNCLSVFDHFVGLALKGLMLTLNMTFHGEKVNLLPEYLVIPNS